MRFACVTGVLLLAILILLTSCGDGQQAQRLAVMGVLQAQQAAWNRGELDQFLDGYHKSPDITFIGNEFSQGFSGIEDRYKRTYGSNGKMGRLTFGDLTYQALGDEGAYVLGRFVLERDHEGGGNASGRFTVVFRNTSEGWKIVHDHTSAD